MAADDVEPRSKERLTKAHLRKLTQIAKDDLRGFFERNRKLKAYQQRPQLTALCQGAAKHYLDHTTGVKDLDVWTFFADLPSVHLQRRRPKQTDFEESTLGRHPDDKNRGYRGRRVDLLLKTIPRRRSQQLDDAVREYLRAGRTETARRLAEKPVIGLDPPEYFGVTIWPGNKRN